MLTFAVVAEGVTDQIVIERVLTQLWPRIGSDDVRVRYAQPVFDETDGVSGKGGWERVLAFCRDGIDDALASNNFVIIQLDTDAADHENFGLMLNCPLGEKGYLTLIAEASNIIAEHIGVDKLRHFSHRIILAICVHSTESWLHAQLFDTEHLKNSFERVRYKLNRSGDGGLEKTARRYRSVVKLFKGKEILGHVGDPSSYGVFLRRLIQSGRCNGCGSEDIEI